LLWNNGFDSHVQFHLLFYNLKAQNKIYRHNKYMSINFKSRRMRLAGHVARLGAKRNAYRILMGKPEGRRPLGRPRRRWVDNIKIDLREIGWDGMDWVDLA
jgi:hypothetical protein